VWRCAFAIAKEQNALQVLESLHQNNNEAFEKTGTPRFSADVKDVNGVNMDGVGFAEEPLLKNESFGTIRANILAEVYFDAKYSNTSASNTDFDFDSSFSTACAKYQVDPVNPAFNVSKGSAKFKELRRRIETNDTKV